MACLAPIWLIGQAEGAAPTFEGKRMLPTFEGQIVRGQPEGRDSIVQAGHRLKAGQFASLSFFGNFESLVWLTRFEVSEE